MNLPKTITVCEVGPRDGFQNIKTEISTDTKIAVIEGLIQSGLKRIQITSFVSPKAIPQMKDASVLCERILSKYQNSDVEFFALVPNKKGAENAYNAGIREISYVMSLSESHNKANINKTRSESVDELKNIQDSFPDLKIQADLAVAFGCPFEGDISEEIVVEYVKKVVDMEVNIVNICDTIGVANPKLVYDRFKKLKSMFKDTKFAIHIHDTRGLGLACALVAIQNNVDILETSIGGLGGCPFAPGAAGNTATEDLVNMLNGMGVYSGIDLEKLLETAEIVKEKIQQNLTGRIVNIMDNCSPAYKINI